MINFTMTAGGACYHLPEHLPSVHNDITDGPRSTPGPASPAAGTLVAARYRLEQVAGRGGMATVWRGTLSGHAGFCRTVAIKQMHAHLAEQKSFVDMFIEEARIGAELHDPHIAQTYDFVHEHGQYYLVVEWVEGIDLGNLLRHLQGRGERMRWEMAAAIGIGILRGLAAAHERCMPGGIAAPIVHRDVSPHNVLLTVKGMVKLIDFGLSLARDRSAELTDPGVVKGKMSYLSPEVVVGERPGPHSDQFAAGAVQWEMLAGRRLFEGPSDLDVYQQLRQGRVLPLRSHRPDVPGRLVDVIHRALSIGPERRFPSSREMAVELGQVLKKSREGNLHSVLGGLVDQARSALALGEQTSDPAQATPVTNPSAELEIEALPVETKRRGLRHRLPFLGRRRDD
jgi:serine/threonine-protein kinase